MDVYLMIFGLAVTSMLLLIYATTRFTALNDRLKVLERNFGESTLGCYDNESEVVE